jgi:hypothetical protein
MSNIRRSETSSTLGACMTEPNKKTLDKFHKVWAQIIARAWSDKKFKQKLLQNPAEVFKEYGLSFPEGIQVTENTSHKIHLILPVAPDEDLTEQNLKQIAAGVSYEGISNSAAIVLEK